MAASDARLKQDAAAVKAEVSAELRMRIDASLRGAEIARPAAPERVSERVQTGGLWWISSLTGLAAAAAVIAYVNFSEPTSSLTPERVAGSRTVPEAVRAPIDLPLLLPELAIESAEFTSPLEEELLKLQLDLEKAQQSVREDIDFTF